jgi:hypothetical protein
MIPPSLDADQFKMEREKERIKKVWLFIKITTFTGGKRIAWFRS